ncbi:MAG: glycerate kinase [Oscillospiraceae bacterium]|nr:glycerate kinase [Oscillospiraceae bacterium]
MRKIILMPDSFKGTMSSMEICSIMREAILEFYPGADVVSIPVADGGEGTVDCFLAAIGGTKVTVPVKGPYFKTIDACYGILPDKTAVIEMSACAGLPLVGDRKSAENTTTYGVGQLIGNAIDQGCGKIILGLGGSATNDGGAGAAAALGVLFFDSDGNTFIPTGSTLHKICSIKTDCVIPKIREVQITVMCDIDNPLCGQNGAAYVFGPQKGADEATVRLLDEGLHHYADVILRDTGMDVKDIPGAGAAGGMGAGMTAFFNVRVQMGIDTVLDTVGFQEIVKDASVIFSGEGRLDSQSLGGKVVVGIARRARNANVPLVAVVGDIADNIDAVYSGGVTAIFSINRKAVPFSEAKLTSKSDLLLTMKDIMRYSKAMLN